MDSIQLKIALYVLITLSIFGVAVSAYANYALSNPVANWDFSEGNGTIASDSSGNGNNGTINGATWTTDRAGPALSFNGVNNYVDAGNGTNLDITNEITLMAWAKTSSANEMVITGRGLTGSSDHTWEHDIENGHNTFYWANGYSMGENDYVSGTKIVNDGQWHHLVARANNTRIEVYTDGAYDNGRDKTTKPNPNTNLKVLIGNLPGYSLYFKGLFDEVKIYNRALSAAEIKAEYDAENSNRKLASYPPTAPTATPKPTPPPVSTLTHTSTPSPVPTLTSTPTPAPVGSEIKINPDKTLSINGKKTFPLMFFQFCANGASLVSNSACLSALQLNTPYDVDLLTMSPDSNLQNYVLTGKYFTTGYSYDLACPKTIWQCTSMIANAPIMKFYEIIDCNFHNWGILDLICTISLSFGTACDSTFASHPNFFGYYNPDEPKDAIHQQLINTYNNLRSRDPNHIVITGLWTSAQTWSDTADVMIAGNYPFRDDWIESYGSRSLSLYGYEYIEKNNPLKGTTNFDTLSKPLWPVIQALSCRDNAGVEPITKTELRALTYTAITFNVKGLSYYSYNWGRNSAGQNVCGLSNNVSMVTDYINLAKEIKSLNDILVLPTIDYSWRYRQGTQVTFDKVLTNTLYGQSVTNFNWMLKRNGGVTYLFVVNKDIKPISNVGITISGLSGTMTATTLGLETSGSGRAGKNLSVTNGKFTDTFDGYAAHIYQIS